MTNNSGLLNNPMVRDEVGESLRKVSWAQRLWRWSLAASLVAMLSVGAGLFFAQTYQMWLIRDLEELAGEFRIATATAERRDLLSRMETLRARLLNNPQGRQVMARVYLAAAETMPQREAYYRAALAELDDVRNRLSGSTEEIMIEIDWQRAQCLNELGRDAEALEAMERYGAMLDTLKPDDLPEQARALLDAEKILWQNALAYLLATAQDEAVRDPERAMTLVAEAVSTRSPFPSGELPVENAAILDTLAEVYFVNGEFARAVEVQRAAMARCQPQYLSIYLEHYDKYCHAAETAPEMVPQP